jgi:protein O-GlcNAc transferase
MGVPVITLKGDEARSRMSLSVLQQTGLGELVAASPERFVDIAVRLASDPHRLQELRSTLRQRMMQSSLVNATHFTRNLENAYREMRSKLA